MARYGGATWRPLPEAATQPTIIPRIVIFHSAVSPGWPKSIWSYFARPDITLESTFYIAGDGTAEQYMDSTTRADANLLANAFAISVETADGGDPDHQPWTPEQLDAMEKLARWCHDVHGIPLVQTPTWDGAGLGYHTLFGAPSQWTPYVKTCPGAARKAQWPGFLARFTTAPKPPDPQPQPEPDPIVEAPDMILLSCTDPATPGGPGIFTYNGTTVARVAGPDPADVVALEAAVGKPPAVVSLASLTNFGWK